MSRYQLRLFVAGRSDRSRRSIAAIQRLVDDRLGGDCDLVIVDVLEDPGAAEEAKVVATPSLVRMSPPPQQAVVGELGDVQRVAEVLGLDGYGEPGDVASDEDVGSDVSHG